jgi:hypothetical protein
VTTVVDWSAEPPVLTLQELIDRGFYRSTLKGAWAKLERGRFPIRHIDTRPYRFNRKDVAAYVERGEKTNPLLLNPLTRPRRLFARVHRAKAVA